MVAKRGDFVITGRRRGRVPANFPGRRHWTATVVTSVVMAVGIFAIAAQASSSRSRSW